MLKPNITRTGAAPQLWLMSIEPLRAVHDHLSEFVDRA